ncbi:hypothetical protein HYALB_00013914 [Hymenoscyphus albidus]|uniref:Extracellular membrane protein CFEM domain-containing protein n=1 Tax=Hymenoscyphus albidus TaxID=595503 RepID=A0A9N9M1L1_9HELO|nr:hypothetical protein HYALB_00013914 [Hymenoscyphus albidus]
MRFSTLPILLVAALTTRVLAGKHHRGLCFDGDSPNADKGSKACEAYKTTGGDNCVNSYWKDDYSVQGDEECYSQAGDIEDDAWNKICQLYKASSGKTA